jgi:hypothetical protein
VAGHALGRRVVQLELVSVGEGHLDARVRPQDLDQGTQLLIDDALLRNLHEPLNLVLEGREHEDEVVGR